MTTPSWLALPAIRGYTPETFTCEVLILAVARLTKYKNNSFFVCACLLPPSFLKKAGLMGSGIQFDVCTQQVFSGVFTDSCSCRLVPSERMPAVPV